MKHILSNARLIGTVTPAPKWYPKHKTRENEHKTKIHPKKYRKSQAHGYNALPMLRWYGRKKRRSHEKFEAVRSLSRFRHYPRGEKF